MSFHHEPSSSPKSENETPILEVNVSVKFAWLHRIDKTFSLCVRSKNQKSIVEWKQVEEDLLQRIFVKRQNTQSTNKERRVKTNTFLVGFRNTHATLEEGGNFIRSFKGIEKLKFCLLPREIIQDGETIIMIRIPLWMAAFLYGSQHVFDPCRLKFVGNGDILSFSAQDEKTEILLHHEWSHHLRQAAEQIQNLRIEQVSHTIEPNNSNKDTKEIVFQAPQPEPKNDKTSLDLDAVLPLQESSSLNTILPLQERSMFGDNAHLKKIKHKNLAGIPLKSMRPAMPEEMHLAIQHQGQFLIQKKLVIGEKRKR